MPMVAQPEGAQTEKPKGGPEKQANRCPRVVKPRGMSVNEGRFKRMGARCDGDPLVGAGGGGGRRGCQNRLEPAEIVTWSEACRPCHELV